MKKIIIQVFCVCAMIVLMTSCVAKRKYLAQRNRADKNDKEIASLNGTIGNLNNKIATLNDSINYLTQSIAGLRNKVGELGYENKVSADQLNMTKEQIANQRKRLAQLQNFINDQQKATEALRQKIADALAGFNTNELTVTTRNGRVYISMQESLLFPSGSAVVNPKGKEALAKVAGVLNNNNDINIDIEGHTDSVPIHNKTYNDNWALSVTRATSIAHVLIDEYSVTPAKLIASGRSHFDPVAPNTTPSGRAQNRRTEIILEPKLDELMSLLNTKN